MRKSFGESRRPWESVSGDEMGGGSRGAEGCTCGGAAMGNYVSTCCRKRPREPRGTRAPRLGEQWGSVVCPEEYVRMCVFRA